MWPRRTGRPGRSARTRSRRAWTVVRVRGSRLPCATRTRVGGGSGGVRCEVTSASVTGPGFAAVARGSRGVGEDSPADAGGGEIAAPAGARPPGTGPNHDATATPAGARAQGAGAGRRTEPRHHRHPRRAPGAGRGTNHHHHHPRRPGRRARNPTTTPPPPHRGPGRAGAGRPNRDTTATPPGARPTGADSPNHDTTATPAAPGAGRRARNPTTTPPPPHRGPGRGARDRTAMATSASSLTHTRTRPTPGDPAHAPAPSARTPVPPAAPAPPVTAPGSAAPVAPAAPQPPRPAPRAPGGHGALRARALPRRLAVHHHRRAVAHPGHRAPHRRRRGLRRRAVGRRAVPYLAHRLDTAAGLYRAGRVRVVLVTGDNSRDDYDEPDAMRAYLTEHGVPGRPRRRGLRRLRHLGLLRPREEDLRRGPGRPDQPGLPHPPGGGPVPGGRDRVLRRRGRRATRTT